MQQSLRADGKNSNFENSRNSGTLRELVPSDTNGGDRVWVKPTPVPPEVSHSIGPLMRGVLLRTVGYLLLVEAAGLTLALTGGSVNVRAFGLGLMLPAGGFLYAGHCWWYFPLALLLFTALAPTVFAGNVPGVIAAWGLLAAGAGFFAHHAWDPALWIVPCASASLVGLGLILSRNLNSRLRVRLEEQNRQIQASKSVYLRSAPTMLGEELSDRGVAHLRFILDRALQPVHQFSGFDSPDSFLMQILAGALRYQLTFSELALAGFQQAHAPAFSGYLNQAQKNLMEKMQDRRVWGYWYYMNLWGNLRLNADPIRKENVMYSGWYGAMLGLYQTVTGDDSFNEPGSIRLRWNKKTEFAYDFKSLTDVLFQQHRDGKDFCIPCEPGQVAAMCNGFSMISLVTSDKLNGTSYRSTVMEHTKAMLRREYIPSGDAHILLGRNRHTGWSARVSAIKLAENALAMISCRANLPEEVERTWEVLRTNHLAQGPDGELEFNVGGRVLDLGNNSFSDIMALAFMRVCARQMGDAEAFEAITNTVNRRFAPAVVDGEIRYSEGSQTAHILLCLSELSRPASIYDLVNHGIHPSHRNGPMLSDVAYPDVIVTRAVAKDGVLHLVLHPGGGTRSQRLKISGLVGGCSYRIDGDYQGTFKATPGGDAEVTISLDRRLLLSIGPTN